MISPKKLIKIAREWQRGSCPQKEKNFISRTNTDGNTSSSSNLSSVADKGYFLVYTADKERFMFPMSYLNSRTFRELLAMSDEEFGPSANVPIILPCDAVFMEYLVSFVKQNVDREMENALLISIANGRCSFSSCPNRGQTTQQLLVCSF